VSLLRSNADMCNEHTATTLSLLVSKHVDLLVHQIGVDYFQHRDRNKEGTSSDGATKLHHTKKKRRV